MIATVDPNPNQKDRSFYPSLIRHGVEFIPLIPLITLCVAGVWTPVA